MSQRPSSDASGNAPPPRQIRFVSNDGLPQTKRRRISAACRTCRKRKIRCSGEQPVCKTCSDCRYACLGYGNSAALDQSKPDAVSPKLMAMPLSDGCVTKRHVVDTVENSFQNVSEVSSAKLPQAAAKQWESNDASTRVLKEQSRNSEGESPAGTLMPLEYSQRTHVPYFRYFGPTAIVPGYKQMVVQVRGLRRSNPSSALGSLSPLRSPKYSDMTSASLASVANNRDGNSIPFYDRDDDLPVSELVTHLCQLFFVRLGCNFPFLREEKFLCDLRDKNIDTMLVDTVCALSAKFSPHPLLDSPAKLSTDTLGPSPDIKKSERGQPFARRAMGALVDSLSCPTLSVVQACLLLAYDEFGSNHDSGLWMYLGISIRMAQDLGMQKLQGIKYCYGQTGLTPSSVVTGQSGELADSQYDEPRANNSPDMDVLILNNQRAQEKEKVDSFWSIFFLDRVISSGTGRPVTLRDEDIELCFPLQSESQLSNGWPAPFPVLIRVIHLYGRVTDLINGIQSVKHVTPETLKRLAGMESYLTGIYQQLSPKLHFNTTNFQAYVKAREGTTFILLHFWFHTLIVLLHQPTLLHSFGGTIQHLYPNSRELSMSSAKTIADILSFSELIDSKSFVGNPFTSQPIYVAACAFLVESAHYSSLLHPSNSPCDQSLLGSQTDRSTVLDTARLSEPEQPTTVKYTLLVSAAKENYQRCYKSLKALETYWEGAKYILTVLDQKAKGIVDPLLYTPEEMESANGRPPMRSSVPPLSRDPGQPLTLTDQAADILSDGRWPPGIDPNQAIGWVLAGASNSVQPSLSLLYQTPIPTDSSTSNKLAYSPSCDDSCARLQAAGSLGQSSYPQKRSSQSSDKIRGAPIATVPAYLPLAAEGVTTSDANLLLGLNTSYSNSRAVPSYNRPALSCIRESQTPEYTHNMPPGPSGPRIDHNRFPPRAIDTYLSGETHTSDVLIESQDIDMSNLHHHQGSPPFVLSGDVLPWLEYLPHDVLHYFGER